MSERKAFMTSNLGMKMVMAITGFLLFGFVLTHMAGNLKMYQGPEKFNAYAEGLRELGAPVFGHGQFLWVARLVLLAAIGLHIRGAWSTARKSRGARPKRYERWQPVQLTYAERTMRYGGVIILFFVLYHLAHLTFGWGWAHPDFVPGDVYHNVVAGFGVWWVSLFYLVAQVFLGFHLYHGLWSLFQSLGISVRDGSDWRRAFAGLFATVVVVGNVSFPLAVLTGIVR